MNRKLVPALIVLALIVSLGASYLMADPTDPVVGPSGAVVPQPAPAQPPAPPAGGMGGGVAVPGGPMPGPAMPPGAGGPAGVPGGGFAPGAMPPGMMPGQPGGNGMPPQFERMGGMIEAIAHMGEAMFNPRIAGIIAIGSLKDEVAKKPADKIKFFEAQLEKTKSLGLRNAIRMTLKDLYKAQGEDEKAVDQLKAMLEENDAAIQAQEREKERRQAAEQH